MATDRMLNDLDRLPDGSLSQAEVRWLTAEVRRLRRALTLLEGWDMLTLNPTTGKGSVTDDAPWARALITEALGGDDTVSEGSDS